MKIEINIPTNLNEITLGDFQLYWSTNKTDKDKLKYLLKLNDYTIDHLARHTILELVDAIDDLLSQEVEFQQFVTLGGVEFGFIPNFENISMAEFIDLDSHISEIETLHTACAVMFRMIDKQDGINYSLKEYNPEHGADLLMKHLPLGVALGAKVFFWNLGRELLEIIPNYLTEEMGEMNTATNINFHKGGDGMVQS